VRERMSFQNFESVQYGCGWQAPLNWLNFDSSPTLRFERIPFVGRLYTKNARRFPENVFYGDIVKGLPVNNGSVARLFASHVIEHLCYQDAQLALKRSHELLKPGGLFRLIVPDLKARAEKYISAADRNSPVAAIDFMRSTMLGRECRPRGLRAAIAETFGGSHHLWMWDEASLSAALLEQGFVNIRRCSFGDSEDPLFAEVEDRTRFIDGDFIEVAIECRRAR
jgi:predicted SAM-dependent methyltransferase